MKKDLEQLFMTTENFVSKLEKILENPKTSKALRFAIRSIFIGMTTAGFSSAISTARALEQADLTTKKIVEPVNGNQPREGLNFRSEDEPARGNLNFDGVTTLKVNINPETGEIKPEFNSPSNNPDASAFKSDGDASALPDPNAQTDAPKNENVFASMVSTEAKGQAKNTVAATAVPDKPKSEVPSVTQENLKNVTFVTMADLPKPFVLPEQYRKGAFKSFSEDKINYDTVEYGKGYLKIILKNGTFPPYDPEFDDVLQKTNSVVNNINNGSHIAQSVVFDTDGILTIGLELVSDYIPPKSTEALPKGTIYLSGLNQDKTKLKLSVLPLSDQQHSMYILTKADFLNGLIEGKRIMPGDTAIIFQDDLAIPLNDLLTNQNYRIVAETEADGKTIYRVVVNLSNSDGTTTKYFIDVSDINSRYNPTATPTLEVTSRPTNVELPDNQFPQKQLTNEEMARRIINGQAIDFGLEMRTSSKKYILTVSGAKYNKIQQIAPLEYFLSLLNLRENGANSIPEEVRVVFVSDDADFAAEAAKYGLKLTDLNFGEGTDYLKNGVRKTGIRYAISPSSIVIDGVPTYLDLVFVAKSFNYKGEQALSITNGEAEKISSKAADTPDEKMLSERLFAALKARDTLGFGLYDSKGIHTTVDQIVNKIAKINIFDLH